MGTQPCEKRKMAALSKTYLASYNGIQALGWSYVLIQTTRHLCVNQTYVGLWGKYSTSLLTFQSLAALEVLHCIVGLVPSNYLLTAIQVSSRLYQVWGIIYAIKEVQNSPFVALVMLSWGLTEAIRYSYYFANIVSKSPKFLTWCRYSFFLLLYPLGVSGELGNIISALGPIRSQQLFSITLPNPANISFSYYYFNILMAASYIPFFPQLFNHMRKQRAKVLNKSSSHPASTKALKREEKIN